MQEFEKRRCHFTYIFELFARFIYVIVVAVVTMGFNMLGSLADDEDFIRNAREILGNGMSVKGIILLTSVGSVVAISLIVLFFCAFRWRYTFLSVEENTLLYESGRFLKKRVAIPFDKINTIDMGRNIFERMVGTCRLKIDTGAYSSSQEKNRSELNLVFSLAEADEIRRYILLRASADAQAEETLSPGRAIADQEPDWVIRAGAGDFILYGLTSSSVWKLFCMLALGGGFVAELMTNVFARTAESLLPSAARWIEDITGNHLFVLLLLLAAVYLGCAIISDVYTMVWASIRFFGFRVAREGRSVIVRYGIFTVKNYTLQVRNIHALIIRQNVFQQILGRCSVEAVCMGFGDEKEETALLFPIIREKRLNDLLSVVLPEYVTEVRTHPRKAAGSLFHLVLPSVWTAVFCAGLYALGVWMKIPTAIVPAVCVILMATRLISGILAYRNTAIDWNERVVSVCSGGLFRCTYRIRTDAVQEVQLKTDLFRRCFGIGSYYVHFHGPTMKNTSVAPHLSDAMFAGLADAVED